MKKLLLYLSITISLLFSIANIYSQTVEIGTGAGTQYLGGLYGFEYYGLLYDASEIGNTTSSKTISAIEFNVYSTNTGNTLTYQIYMKATNATQLYSCGTEYFSNYTNGATQVFNGSGVLNATGWQTINLNTPFTLPAGSNLLIAIKATSSSTSGGCSRTIFCSTVTNNRFWYTWKDGTDQGASACGSSSTCTNTRPNIRLTLTEGGVGGGGGGTEPCADYIIGTGTSGQTYSPLNSWWNYNYTQQIYTNTELAVEGITPGMQINSIAFYYVSGGATIANYNNWTVYLANTSQNNFTSTTNWIGIGNFTQVYSGNIPLTGTAGWVTINLTTPFIYTGQNLCVAVHENVTGNSGSPGASWQSSTTTSNQAIYYYNDNTTPNLSSPPTANNISTTRPNIKINACETVTPTNTHNVPSTGNDTWTTCEGHLYDSGGSTGNYANNSSGYTVIYPDSPNSAISISGTLFAETIDKLFIYDGVGTTGILLATISGIGTSDIVNVGPITSSNGPLTVKFYSDGSIVGAGFDLTVSCVMPNTIEVPSSGTNTVTSCNILITDDGGLGGNYSNNCNGYTIIYPDGDNQLYIIGSYNTEEGVDFINIYEGEGITGTLIATLSGSGNIPEINPIVSNTINPITIQFVSNGSNVNSGFSLNVYCGELTAAMRCFNGIPFCSGTDYSFPAATNVPNMGGVGCLITTPNPEFYWMQIDNSGDIIITMDSYSSNGNTHDVDYIAWGPFNTLEEGCSSDLMNNPGVSCSYSTAAHEEATISNAQSGEIYILLITNYANVITDIYFGQTNLDASNAGSTNCEIVAPPINSNGPLCIGETLTLSPTYPVSGASYQWTGPNGFSSTQQNVTIPNVTTANAGVYTLVITLNGLSSNPMTTTVEIYTHPTAGITNNTGTTVISCGNTSISLTATGGDSYLWNNGLTNANISINTAGTYSVTVSNVACSDSESITITETLPTITNTNANPNPICLGQETTLSATGTGEEILWYNVATGGTSIATGNTYNVTATTTGTVTYYVETYCESQGNGTGTPITFEYTGGEQIYTVPTGVTQVQLEVWGAQGGSASSEALGGNGGYSSGMLTVTPGQQLYVNVGGKGSGYPDRVNSLGYHAGGYNGGGQSYETTAAEIRGSGGGATHIATASGVLASLSSNQSAVKIVAGAGGGNYTYNSGKGTAGVGGGTNGTNGINNANNIMAYGGTAIAGGLSASGYGDGSFGQGGSHIGTNWVCGGGAGWYGGGVGNGGGGGSGYIGGVTNAITIAGDTSMPNPNGGNMIGRQGHGCARITPLVTATSQQTSPRVPVTITVTPTPTVTVADQAICLGETATLTANVSGATGVNYNWSNGGGTNQTASYSPTTTTTYTVTVSTASGCSNTATATVTINPQPTVTVADQAICLGETATLTANVSGATGVNYNWSNSGGTNQTASYSPTTTTTYTVTVSTASGCSNTATATVTINPQPTVTVADQAICLGETATLTANVSGATGVNYNWSNSGGTNQTASYSPTTTTTYTVTVSTASGCSNTATGTVTINTPPTANITNNTGTTTLTCTVQTINLTATGGTTYTWNNGLGNTANVSVTNQGNYIVTVTDINGCTNTANIVIDQNITPPNADITNNSGTNILTCDQNSISLTATGGVAYAWSNGENIANINVTTAGTYTVTVTGTNGCTATANINITQDITPPTANITNNTGTTTLTCAVQTISLTATGGASYVWSNGLGSSANASISAPGNYSVTVTGTNGCTASQNITISQNTTTPIASINTPTTTVLTCNTQSISLTATGGVTYAWNNGLGTNADVTVNNPGNYIVTVTAANGCTASANITISQNITPPTATINTPATSTLTCNTTSINLTATGGATYAWSNGSNTANTTILAAGTYTVTVTGTNGCTANANINITQNITPPIATITNNTGTNILNCNTQTISLTANGGTSYAWSNGNNGANVSINNPNNYIVTVTGTNGCTATANINITQDITPPSANITNNTGTTTLTCAVQTISLTATGGASYVWSNGLGSSANASISAPGNYSVTVTGTNGCTASQNITISQNTTTPIASINTPTTTVLTCNTQSISLTATGGVTYAWNNGLGTNADVTVNNPGNYIVTVTATNGCTASANITISQNITAPIATINTPATSTLTCNTTSINLTATGGATYAWSNGSNTANTTILAAGTYTVTVTGTNGCTSTANININEDYSVPALVINTTPNTTELNCENPNILLTANSNVSVSCLWNNTEIINPNLSVTEPGTYTVVATATNGCTNSASINITEDFTTPIAHIENNSGTTLLTCSQESISLTAIGDGTYEWNNSMGTATTINVTEPGIYNVTVTASNGCTASDEIIITQTSPLTLEYNIAPIACYGETATITLTALGGTEPYIGTGTFVVTAGTYNYNVNDANGCVANTGAIIIEQPEALHAISDITMPVACNGGNATVLIAATGGTLPYSGIGLQELTAGNYTFEVSDANGCKDSTTININEPVEIVPEIIITQPVTCYGMNNGALSVNAIGGLGGFSYQWNVAGTTNTNNISNLYAGNYTVTITDQGGCKVSVTATIPQPERMMVSLDKNDILCYGDNNGSVEFIVSGGTQPYTYTFIGNNINSHSRIQSNLQAGDYEIIINDKFNCSFDSVISILEANEIIIQTITQNPSCIEGKNGSIDLEINGGNYPYEVFLNEISYKDNIHLGNLDKGNYNIYVIDSNACISQTVAINLSDENKECIEIPNAITPNGDGINDTWVIDGINNFDNYVVNVFNRWGQAIFESDDYIPWDGTYKGKKVPTGTYLYVISLYGQKKYTGTLSVIY